MRRDLVTVHRASLVSRSNTEVSVPLRVWQFLGQDKAHLEDSLVLSPSERIVMSTRRHWLVPCRKMVPMAAVMPAAFMLSVALEYVAVDLWWLQLMLWVGTAAHCVMIGYRIMVWRADLITVTDGGRLMRVQGVLERQVSEIRLSEITNRDMSHSLMGRLFDYGTLRLESGGQHDEGSSREYLTHVPHADRIFALVHEHTLQTGWQQIVRQAVRNMNGTVTW